MDQTRGLEDDIESSKSQNGKWHLFGKACPKTEIVFFVQVFLVYIVVIVAIVNLTIGRADDKLWTALLSSSIGYILPSPTLKIKKS